MEVSHVDSSVTEPTNDTLSEDSLSHIYHSVAVPEMTRETLFEPSNVSTPTASGGSIPVRRSTRVKKLTSFFGFPRK